MSVEDEFWMAHCKNCNGYIVDYEQFQCRHCRADTCWKCCGEIEGTAFCIKCVEEWKREAKNNG